MEFLLSSESRLIAQLNRANKVFFGPKQFVFGAPEALDAVGLTRVVITPVSDKINGGKEIPLTYPRRLLDLYEIPIRVLPALDDIALVLGTHFKLELRKEGISPGAEPVGTDGWLVHLDDYMLVGTVLLQPTLTREG